ncbi:MAG: YkgJ family cysteine cluster protein [Desulfobacteraceae bacterium]|nr:MAG: YkgJ family cysteine cluster protein [Desulfobacteraceae bacterium]
MKKNEHDDELTQMAGEVADGLLYTHARLTYNIQHTLKNASFLYALIELLDEKKIITIEELEERKRKTAEQLIKRFEDSRIGLLYQEPEEDKYLFEPKETIDCEPRLPVCKAICCRIPFALSKQDVEERTIRWEFGRPYLIGHDDEGYCVHLDKKSYRCNIYEQRPVPCRGFNCKENERWSVWRDYEGSIMNPDFKEQVEQSNAKMYAIPK